MTDRCARAKVHYVGSVNANEMIVLPSAMSERDADYPVAFAVPIDTPV